MTYTSTFYDHPDRGQTEVVISSHSLSILELTYAGTFELRVALGRLGVDVRPWNHVFALVQRCWRDGWVVGCSGYATAGHDYTHEARALERIYQRFADTAGTNGLQPPVLSVDGGGSAGVLGLNGVIAANFGIATLGCMPLCALAEADTASRTHTLLWGATYRQRECLVGTLPDVLFCVGGGAGARRECQEAIRHGSVAVLVMPRDYDNALADEYVNFDDLREAAEKKRLIVCRPGESVEAAVDQALEMAAATRDASRQSRAAALAGWLRV